MKKDIAKKWVRALRSKKYRQAIGVLKTKTKAGSVSHCCLGVLCELYQQEREKVKKPLLQVEDFSARGANMGLPGTNRVFEFSGSTQALPYSVCKWAGIDDDTGGFRRNFTLEHRQQTYSGLAEMNDHGCRFSTIADIIEKYFKQI